MMQWRKCNKMITGSPAKVRRPPGAFVNLIIEYY